MEPWIVTAGAFVATQVGSLIWILASQKTEGRLLKADISRVQTELEKLSNVLVNMADMRGEINLLNARMLAQGARLDEEITRSNTLRDRLTGPGNGN